MLFVATVTYLPDCGRAIWVITRPCADSRMREPSCRADRTRTCNLRFWRPLLYQLSHRPSAQSARLRCKIAQASHAVCFGWFAKNGHRKAWQISTTAHQSRSLATGCKAGPTGVHSLLLRAPITLSAVTEKTRISPRIAAIAESATLKVDSKAK